ncbi:MAG: DUF2184 domain-containing protein [Actinobacteria bacterium]|nr:DUF2184 domain-containing protein [Actinomycetota bacterium]
MTLVSHGRYTIDAADSKTVGRLDQGESVFFLRQLEYIDTQAYMVKYPALMGRRLLPSISVPSTMHAYTYGQYKEYGIGKLIANMGDDLPMVNVAGSQFTSRIVPIGDAYGYDIFEIQAAAATGFPLDALKAQAARYACEVGVDYLLAAGTMPDGTTITGVLGLYNQTGTTPYTPITKQLGGTNWGTLQAPNATGDEVAADIMGIAANLYAVTKQIWQKFKIILPVAQYNYAIQKRLGSVSDTTALAFAMANCPYIESIEPWWNAPANTMVAFPNDPVAVGAIVSQEWTPEPPQARNLMWIINSYMKTGGVVSKYPVAISYGVGI